MRTTRLTSVQGLPSDNGQGAPDSAERRQSPWYTQNAHGKLNLEEDDGGPLPADRPELDAILGIVEDLLCLEDLFLESALYALGAMRLDGVCPRGLGVQLRLSSRHDVNGNSWCCLCVSMEDYSMTTAHREIVARYRASLYIHSGTLPAENATIPIVISTRPKSEGARHYNTVLVKPGHRPRQARSGDNPDYPSTLSPAKSSDPRLPSRSLLATLLLSCGRQRTGAMRAQ